jgi:BolA protein
MTPAAKPPGPVQQAIRAKLTTALAPVRLDIADDSHLHAGHIGHPGHAGGREGGETHFRVHVVSAAFAGKSRVARQREVYALLAAELAGPVHALSVKAETPEEARSPGSGQAGRE